MDPKFFCCAKQIVWLALPFPDEHLNTSVFCSLLPHSELFYHFPFLFSACENSIGRQKETQGKTNELCLR